MKTHYSHRDQDDEDQAACGTWLGEASELSGNWPCVNCGRCIKQKEKITLALAAEERAIVQQMGDMANFMRAALAQQVTKDGE